MANEVSSSSSDAWSLSIKPVGAEHSDSSGSGLPSKDFTIEVSPDDDLTSLYERIEGVTGLKASQQRLIYRGQLIGRTKYGDENQPSKDESPSNNPVVNVKGIKIKDIRGLSNGQTIHLVKRRDQAQEYGPNSGGDPVRRAASPGVS